jgi:hypothetical protein
MDVDTHKADKLETGSTCTSSLKDTDLSVATACNAVEASAPMPASSSLHTEQQESPVTWGQADVEMQPDEELSDEEDGMDDEEKNANNTTHQLGKNTVALD